MTRDATDSQRFRPSERIVGRRDDDDPVIRLEIYGILILAFAGALLLALLSFHPADVTAVGGTRHQPAHNIIGPIGAHVADIFLAALGLGAFAMTSILALLGLSYVIGRRWRLTRADVLGGLGLLVSSAVLLHVVFSPSQVLGHTAGGLIGEYVGEVTRALLSTTGTLLVALTLLVVSLIALTRRSIFELSSLVWRGSKACAKAVVGGVARVLRHGDRAEDEDADGAVGPADAAPAREAREAPRREARSAEDGAEAGAGEEAEDDGPVINVPRRRSRPSTARQGAAAPAAAPAEAEAAAGAVAEAEAVAGAEAPEAAGADTDAAEDDGVAVEAAGADEEPDEGPLVDAPPVDLSPSDDDAFRIVESAAMRRSRELVVGEQLSLPAEEAQVREFELPTLAYLDYQPPEGQTYDRAALRENAQILEKKLADYKVQGRVVEIHPGPVVTMYEFKPAPGIKISAIANLADDLAMALSALRIRIVAPIPGKDVVGIEVPNKTRETVFLKEVLSDPSYAKAKSKLTLGLGKDIVGNPTTMDLSKAPHLLVAGATGAGKSVAINSFIVSMLYKATPQDVRLIMIDPKMLELSIYEGIPHLLLPVVTDPKQAATALRWAVKEMERRYRLMADLGVRNLSGYNQKVEQVLASPDRLPDKLVQAKVQRQSKGVMDPTGVVLDGQGNPLDTLPYVVVIIDELADLMMVAAKEVEISIARLAQMARAAGIHLVLATQRPSVDVITGLIKANFPSRISFRVASKIDSRTILDQQGAENLLGMGDMLWLTPGASAPKRVHGCFVSEDEVHLIVKHLKQQGEPDYQLHILEHDDEAAEGDDAKDRGDDYDELYDDAVRVVAETQNASISFLQRKLKIGYNRAARIVEKMEEEGVVGPSDGTSRPREVFVDPI